MEGTDRIQSTVILQIYMDPWNKMGSGLNGLVQEAKQESLALQCLWMAGCMSLMYCSQGQAISSNFALASRPMKNLNISDLPQEG